MANDELSTNGSVATLEREDSEGQPPTLVITPAEDLELAEKAEREEKKRKKKDEDGDLEREIELVTPFGKIELEFEPTEKKLKKDQERREKAERQAAKAAEKAQQKLAKQAEKRARGGRGGGGRLLLILLVIGLIGAAIAVAWWLFARPVEELDQVPEDLRVQPEPEPQGALARLRTRIRHAVREGQRASVETQREQMRRYEDVTGGR